MPPTGPKYYYAVKGGPTPGVYGSWPEALAHGAQGVPGVTQRKFKTLYEAEAFVDGAVIIQAPVLKDAIHFDHDWTDLPVAEIKRRHIAQNNARKNEGSINIATSNGNTKCSIVIKSDTCDAVYFINSPAEMAEIDQPSWFVEASFSGANPYTPFSIDVKVLLNGGKKHPILVHDSILPTDGQVISRPLDDEFGEADSLKLEVKIACPNANLPTFNI